MTMKPEALAKLEKSNKIKERAKKIIELDEKIKELDILKEKKSEIVSEIVELLGEELAKEKTMHFDFPDLNKRVIIEGRDEKTFPPEIDSRIKMELDTSKGNVEKIKEIAKINDLIIYKRSYIVKVTRMTKPKD